MLRLDNINSVTYRIVYAPYAAHEKVRVGDDCPAHRTSGMRKGHHEI